MSSETPSAVSNLPALLGAAALLTGVVLVSPWHLTDPDVLSNLAVGRAIVATGTVPATDPLTYSAPEQRWSNPEWLGQLLLYTVHRAGGELGLQLYKLLLIGLGWLLVYLLALRRGATPGPTLALLLIMLLAATIRFTLRNHIHAYWLIPLYGLVLERSRRDERWLLALLPLGVLWANLHSSFVLGWALIGAALVQRLLEQPRQRRALLALTGILALHPLLALVSPHGIHNYGQVLDHLLGSETYRQLLAEWQPPSQISLFKHLPLHVMGLVGLLSFLPRVNRRQLQALLLLSLGLALAYSSQRFILLMAVLAAPGVAANLARLSVGLTPRVRWLLAAGALVIAAGLLLPVIWLLRTTNPNPHLLQRRGAPVAAARFVARAAPSGTRLFNPFNAGPWLLHAAARCDSDCLDRGARVRLYIDPRNNLGASMLQRFFQQIRPHPRRFDAEAKRLKIGLAMFDLADTRAWPLNLHLDASPGWTLVYFDGRYPIYARRLPRNNELLRRHAYRRIRAQLGFEYLLSAAGAPATTKRERALQRDLLQLREQAPALARALRAYRALSAAGQPPPRLPSTLTAAQRVATTRARVTLERALPLLPPSAERFSYLAAAMARLGDLKGCRELLEQGQALFEDAPTLLLLEAELARRGGDHGRRTELLRRLRQRAPVGHSVWSLVSGRPLQVR